MFLLLFYESSGEIPVCTPDNMGSNPFCFPSGYNKDMVPSLLTLNKTLEIHVDTYILEVSKIDDIALTVTFELYMDLMWKESRLIINENHLAWDSNNSIVGSTNFITEMWLPDIQISMCKQFTKSQIVTDLAGFTIFKNRNVLYTVSAEVIVACPFEFSAYPLDHQTCKFLVGSYMHEAETLTFKGSYGHNLAIQRAQPYVLQLEDLDYKDTFISFAARNYSYTGFQVQLRRRRTPVLLQVYLPTSLFVIVSWTSFIIPPEDVGGRMALLVTLFLVLVNIFTSVTENAPKAEGLTAVETWVMACIIHVFGVLAEYALTLKIIHNSKQNEVAERKKEQKKTQGQMELDELNLYKPPEHSERGQKDQSADGKGQDPQSNRLYMQFKKYVKNEKHEQLQELVDKVAMYLFPFIFIIFNLIYWPYYLI